jgi:amidase
MTVNLLAPGQLEAIAAAIGLSLSGADIKSFLGLLKPLIDSYQVVDRLPDELPAVSYPAPGYRPSGAENPYNA